MKDCAFIKALLPDLASGKADQVVAEKVKNHIEECESCRKEYEAQRFYFENLPRVSEYLNNTNKDITSAVMQKIKEEKENPPVYVPKRFHFSYGTAASLVLVAALFIFAMKTGIADKNGFDGIDLARSECAVEEEADMESAPAEYGFKSASLASGATGSAYEDNAYFAVNDACDGVTAYNESTAAEKPTERIMMMSAPPAAECTEESAAVEAEEPETKMSGTQFDAISPLTVDKLREIVAEKGKDLTWGDFEGYEYSDVGSGIYIYRYPISDLLYLTISGVPDDVPFEIRLVCARDPEDFITLPDGDIDGFINRISN